MTNDISKHYSVKLETKSTAKLNNNYLNFNYGDDITLSISIMDDGNPKNIDNCEVDMIIVNESRINPIIHNFSDGGITVANNVVTIVCKSGYIDMIGVNIAQLIIRNADQNISTQMFVYNTVSTLSSNDVESAIDGINTVHDIYELIDRMNSVLESVGSSTDELEGKVNDADTLVRTLVDKANTEIAGVNSIIEQAKASEDERKAAELLRIQNEDTRVSSENLRIVSETTREQNELTRNTSETSRIEAELVRTNSENKRVTTENLRVEAEIKRSENEAGRMSAEQARVLEFETIKGEQESFKESINEQILNSKTDYFGEEHLTVDKRLNEDFDKLWQFNNKSQLLEYSGTNITANDSYYGLVKNLTIKGRTLQNLSEINKVVINTTNKHYKTSTKLMKPNTTYTHIVIVVKNTLACESTTNVVGLNEAYVKTPFKGSTIPLGSTGIFKQVSTTPSDISNISDFTSIRIYDVVTDGELEVIELLLEGDYTNTPLSELPFIEGIKSVGENEVTEDGKYKVKVKSCGKNIFNVGICSGTVNADTGKDIAYATRLRTIEANSIKPNTSYSLQIPDGYLVNRVYFYDAYKNYIINLSVESQQRVFTTPDNAYYIKISFRNSADTNTTMTAQDIEIISKGTQLEEGTVATDYEPYKETVVEYYLDNIHMGFSDKVNDEIDLDNDMLIKRIGKIVFDGSEETWTNVGYNGHATRNTFEVELIVNDYQNNTRAIRGLSEQFSFSLTTGLPEEWGFRITRNSGRDYFLFSPPTSVIPYRDTASWKAWLSQNPVTVYYELPEPIVTQLERQQIFSQEGMSHIFSDNLLPPTISCSIPSNVPAVVSSLRLENATLNNEVATLSLENEQLKENNDTQDEVINVSLLATDEMYNMLEPILSMTAEISTLEVGEVSKMVDLYVAMIQRGLKTIDQVPERYRKQVQDILDKLDE